jgi:CRP-like cAMP-binding protein
MGATNVELLQSHPLLSRLSDAQLLRFAEAGELELFQPREDIVVAGSLGDALYLILSGTATVHPPRGGAPIAHIGPGEFFGEMSLVEPALRSATVRAAELCELFRLPHFAVANLLQDDPAAMNVVLVTVVRVLSQRLRHSNQLVGDVGQLSAFLASSVL